MIKLALKLAEEGHLPSFFLNFGAWTFTLLRSISCLKNFSYEYVLKFWSDLAQKPLDIFEDEANLQHYEFDSRFFDLVLGKWKKYSCCYFKTPYDDLSLAEEQILDLYISLVGDLGNKKVLDLGCGWGSLTGYLLSKFPEIDLVSVTNSFSQKEFIESRYEKAKVIKTPFSKLELKDKFDIIFVIEMLEHIQNWPEAFKIIRGFLKDNGRLFIHFFGSRFSPYIYDQAGSTDWMAQNFFSGGLMPSPFFLNFQEYFKVVRVVELSGLHYKHTAAKWLDNLEKNKEVILNHFQQRGLSLRDSEITLNRWRMFFIGCKQFFGFLSGRFFKVYLALLEAK